MFFDSEDRDETRNSTQSFFLSKKAILSKYLFVKETEKNEVRDGGGSRSNFIWICAKGLVKVPYVCMCMECC